MANVPSGGNMMMDMLLPKLIAAVGLDKEKVTAILGGAVTTIKNFDTRLTLLESQFNRIEEKIDRLLDTVTVPDVPGVDETLSLPAPENVPES